MSMRPLGSSVDLPIPLDLASGLPTLLYPCEMSPSPEDRAEAPLATWKQSMEPQFMSWLCDQHDHILTHLGFRSERLILLAKTS